MLWHLGGELIKGQSWNSVRKKKMVSGLSKIKPSKMTDEG